MEHKYQLIHFRGQSYRNLDTKGRMVMPPEFRNVLDARAQDGIFVLTMFDNCIVGYPQADWLEFEEKFASMQNASRKIRDFRRTVIGGAETLTLDQQGRVRLTRAHIEYAALEHEIVLVGQGKHFEIWDQKRFKALLEQDFDDVAEELSNSNIDFFL